MDVSLTLGLVMILASVLVFVLLHSVLRRVPWENTFPRERFRWPVFNWFPLVLITAIVVALGSNLWFTYRAEHPGPLNHAYSTHDTRDDVQPVRGTDPK